MTFKEVVIKNFKYNFKTYSAYFICSTFTITLFFIFTTLFYNKSVMAFFKQTGEGSDFVLYIALISTFLFSIFFISYVHTSMKTSRSKEFGLMMTLGMTAKDIARGIVIEDIILSAESLISGVLIGSLFSRLVHMFINKLLDLHVPYNLSYKSYLVTLCGFLIIFTLVIFYGWMKTRKIQIIGLLKEQRKTEYISDGNIIGLVIGIILTIILIAISLLAIHNRDIALNFKITIPSIGFGLLGMYLLVVNLFPKLLYFIKKRKSFYDRNMIMLSEVKYSIGKNKKLIYMSSILCTVIIYSFASSLGLFSIIDNIVDSNKGADIEYIEAFNVNNFGKEKINKLIDKQKLSLKSRQNAKCIFLTVNGLSLKYKLPIVAISNSTFNRLSRNKINIKEGFAKLTGDRINLPKAVNNIIQIPAGSSTLKLGLLKPVNFSVLDIDMYLQYSFTVILNNHDYNQLETSLPQIMTGTIYRYKFKDDWRKTKALYNKMTVMSKTGKNAVNKTGLANTLNISGRYGSYLFMKKLYSIFIFVFIFLSLLFYVASVLMLFLRQFESLDRTKRKYNQLRKIGITKKEFGKGVLGETRIIFLTPVVFGIILAYSFMLITESMVGGASFVKVFMRNTVILTCIYILLQFFACELSGRRFLNRVIEE